MPGRLDELSLLLGGIKNQLETIVKTQAEDRVAAAQYRTDIRKEMRTITDTVAPQGSEIATIKQDVAELKSKVAPLIEDKLMSAGASRLAIYISKGLYLISAAIGGVASMLFYRWLFGSQPPPH